MILKNYNGRRQRALLQSWRFCRKVDEASLSVDHVQALIWNIHSMTLNFSGRHYPSDIIMQALRYYLAYKLSYREIEEIFAERNISFDHSTLSRWVIKYAPQLEVIFRKRKRRIADSWRMDETYIKVKG